MPERDRSPADDGVAAWAALLRCHAVAVPVIARDVQTRSGLALSWYDVLLELHGAEGGRLRMQDLGARVVLSRSRVSRIVEEMVDAGLIVREVDPDDRRSVFARVTARGERQLREAAPVYLDAIGRLFSRHLTAREQAAVAAALSRVVDALDGGAPAEHSGDRPAAGRRDSRIKAPVTESETE